MIAAACRSCAAPLARVFVDLGVTPPCESYVSRERYNQPEANYPLRAMVCESCYLVQVEALVPPTDIFTQYAYFSSYSDSWVEHARQYVAQVTTRFGLDGASLVVEVGSNDGYLLQHFVAAGVPCLGIEPAANVATAARQRRVPTEVAFFREELARRLAEEGRRADLIVGNNVLAQVDDLHDFVSGLGLLLKPRGVITLELPHLMRLMEQNQFDTIYHEHYSYFSLLTLESVLARHRLRCFDVDELATHGGSLRLYLCHEGNDTFTARPAVADLIARERDAGLDRLDTYSRFAERVKEAKRAILSFLIAARREGRRIAGYGAPGKGNTLLNYCGIGTDFLDYTVDRNPYKQGKFLPGSRIPIHPPETIFATKPDYVLVLPWNLAGEIIEQMSGIRAWGGRFVIPIPALQVLP